MINDTRLCGTLPALSTCCEWKNGACQSKLGKECWDSMDQKIDLNNGNIVSAGDTIEVYMTWDAWPTTNQEMNVLAPPVINQYCSCFDYNINTFALFHMPRIKHYFSFFGYA